MYKFCNILILGGAWPGRTKHLRAVPEISVLLTPLVDSIQMLLVNIEDSKIASEFISDDVASSMKLLSDF